ncbi:hypothetical protein EJ07DRAFT_155527 [Lizonia empirigonia]|nr:hypothetical protein EJ07DRAFT_155527 [Lizonia empirigonia]
MSILRKLHLLCLGLRECAAGRFVGGADISRAVREMRERPVPLIEVPLTNSETMKTYDYMLYRKRSISQRSCSTAPTTVRTYDHSDAEDHFMVRRQKVAVVGSDARTVKIITDNEFCINVNQTLTSDERSDESTVLAESMYEVATKITTAFAVTVAYKNGS